MRRWTRAALLAATSTCVIAAATADVALAATAVRVEPWASTPLVIDPTTSPGAISSQISLGQAVAFIQKMPYTKTITKVTLGDFGQASGCATTQVQLYVREHTTGDIDTSSQIAYSTDTPALPTAPGKVTFTIPPTNLVAGRGYSFRLHMASGCNRAIETTSPHNSTLVNGGPSPCVSGVFVTSSGSLDERLSSGAPLSDVAPKCVRSSGSAYDPTAIPAPPSGWLVATGTNILTSTALHHDPPTPPAGACTDSGSNDLTTMGAEAVYWRPVPGETWKDQFVCRWKYYGPKGVDLIDGWYFGLPWAVNGGAPRDVYLALYDTSDASYAATYRPRLLFDSAEHWRPLTVSSFLTERDPSDASGLTPWNQVCSSLDVCSGLASADSLTGNAYIAMPGNPNDAASIHSPNAGCVGDPLYDCDSGAFSSGYYHVVASPTSGYKYVDYWYFYRDNYFDGTFDGHEGDWESVTVAPSKLTPGTFDFASLSAHGTWYSYLRQNVTCDNGESCGSETAKSGQRIRVYVANGTHAGYPDQCINSDFHSCDDPATPLAEENNRNGNAEWGNDDASPTSTTLPLTENWVGWDGHWGDPHQVTTPATESPRGPAFQAPHWDQPWGGECGDGNDGCVMTGKRAVRARPSLKRSPGFAADGCDNWFAGAVVTVVCSPRRLRGALRHRTVGRHGALHIRRPLARLSHRGRRTAASANGLTQLVGAPMHLGETLELRGRAPSDAELLVRGLVKGRLVVARLKMLGMSRRRSTAGLTLRRIHGRAVFELGAAGRGHRATAHAERHRESG